MLKLLASIGLMGIHLCDVGGIFIFIWVFYFSFGTGGAPREELVQLKLIQQGIEGRKEKKEKLIQQVLWFY